jgi:aminoglycoside phosphotransferase family enzyme/predicted kinase
MASATARTIRQGDVVAFLESGAAFGDARPRRIDTHAAHVFLVGDRAWKLKRAVRFPYLDFTSAEQRRAALDAELRLNRRTAPSLYRSVHPITIDGHGQLAIDGPGDAVDWLLEMRRFADGALLAELADNRRLDEPLLIRLANRVAAFHDRAESIPVADASTAFREVVTGNIASMRQFPALLPADRVGAVESSLLTAVENAAGLLDARGRAGRVRRGHGDLHLANIAMVDGRPTPFDCVEFSEALATVDVLYDLAFLLMDLWRRDLRREANIVFNRYLDLSPADEAGVALMPLFLASRAVVRAHVLAAQDAGGTAHRYLDLALALLAPVAPRLVAIGGLSGTGKSTLARALGGDIGRAPGARILRSDVLRKRLAGVSPETKLAPERYTAKATHEVYGLLGQRAALALAGGQSVIADAVFARAVERRSIAAVAELSAVDFTGLWLKAAGPLRVDRVARRGPDASDADARVAMMQSRYRIGQMGDWWPIPAGGSPGDTAVAARAALDRSLRRGPP